MKVNGSESADVDAAPPMQGAPVISTSPAAPAPSAPPARKWIDVKTAAAHAGVGVRIIYDAIRTKKLRASPVGARGQYRLLLEWVDDYLCGLSEPIDDAPSHGRVRSR